MTILGISAFYHDSAAALVEDGRVIAAAQEERFTRRKNDASFPANAVRYCLEAAGCTIDDLDAVVFYDKPLLKFERLLESYHAVAPRGLRSFLKAMPVWMKQKLMLRKVIRDELALVQPFNKHRLPLLFTEHHLSHAASAFYPSPFSEAAILTIDGVGEWATTSIGIGRRDQLRQGAGLAQSGDISRGDISRGGIRFLREMHFPHSLGLLYSAFTYYCGFRVNSGEYKLMGLAPYGDETSEQFKDFYNTLVDRLCTLYPDGSLYLHQEYFTYVSGLRMVHEPRWTALFGFPPRAPEAPIEPHHHNMALAIQRFTETAVLRLAATARDITGCDNLCLAGGVALNCVANGKLLDSALFRSLYIQPASGDAGGALGAALAAHHLYFAAARPSASAPATPAAPPPYLGPSFTPAQARSSTRRLGAIWREYPDTHELMRVVAGELAAGKIVGWFQGRMEFGPRALGNRSILADPRRPDMQRDLNLRIKYRESFRPFAPACTLERAAQYFNLDVESPYMLLTHPLAVDRHRFPAVTHVDGSCRIQTVTPEDNPMFYQLLKAFESETGEAMLINTSFNVRGEPVVCTPTDAYRCFMHTEMDLLVIGHDVYEKPAQPPLDAPRPAPRPD
ncbi:MAG TPA: carbamoyltransferase N-terminal domain-containing protein [Dinghuibacter sp.]|uniref:carbamoyltransferase family protein n=1 Tax=Dinghuibacter sp. TaxID=2024697 RepID=UPI002C3C1D6C|nr:carbamoyltransferase N-terminal domain-containing protein [Dinghuibacter sp.]HTJ14915.1 carbamoyltransferase N-terminal domain-containing protein [Dinghuibacter sp.]